MTEQHKQYDAKLRAERKAYALNYLGGKCAWCNATDDLQFDHKDPSTKFLALTTVYGRSFKVFKTELDKCQLLCTPCHKAKTAKEKFKPIPHGTANGYTNRGCRCLECTEAHRMAWYVAKYKVAQ